MPRLRAPGRTPTQTWAVSGSVGGAYPDWLWNPSAPSAYTAGPVDATLAPGGIPFEQGDAIRLSVEGGQLRWRRDGGAWTLADLYGGAVSLGNGLSLTAVPGPAPSFLAGDTWSFRAAATYGPDRLRQPREGQALEWIGASVTLNVDLGTSTPIEAVLIALHTLPGTAAVTIRGGVAAANEWTLTPAWTAGPMLAMAPAGTQARYLSLQVTGAGAGAAIGWLWGGVPWAPTTGVSSMQHVRQYGLTRAGGRNPTALYRGRGTGGNWAWSLDAEAALQRACSRFVEAISRMEALARAEGADPANLPAEAREMLLDKIKLGLFAVSHNHMTTPCGQCGQCSDHSDGSSAQNEGGVSWHNARFFNGMHSNSQRLDECTFFKAHIIRQLKSQICRVDNTLTQATMNGGSSPKAHIWIKVIHTL